MEVNYEFDGAPAMKLAEEKLAEVSGKDAEEAAHLQAVIQPNAARLLL